MASIARMVKLLIVIWLLTVISAKIANLVVGDSPADLLHIYGICVTLIVLMTFSTRYIFYKDPYKRASRNPAALAARPLVTCMVAVHNEEKVIRQCINSLLDQTYDNKEIVFVNDRSTDGTAAILDSYASQGLIKVIHLEKNLGKKRALGRAMLEAKGELFAFSDSDSIWAPDAIEKIVAVFANDVNVGAVSGHCRALNADENFITKVQDSWYEGQFSIRKAFESAFESVTCVSGPLAVFRRAAVYNYVPAWENDQFLGQEFRFATDRTMTGFVLGSREIGEKLKAKYADSPFIARENYPTREWKVLYCKSARSWTVVPDTFERVLKQQIRWKKSFIRNTFFTGTFYWRKPLPTALLYYLHILFVTLGPLITLRHIILLPLSGDILSPFIYLGGIIMIGFCFGVAARMEAKDCKYWAYRPFMSVFSTLVLSWLIYYSAMTIKKMVWSRA
jgi:cellulose synthase/poly-beta-1,6-N-acetylglucosamine synthase-like glycosyltransferase